MDQKIEKIYIENVTSEEIAEEITETETNSFDELIEVLESNNPDSIYFFDASLSVLLNYLYEGGYKDNDIITLNNNFYGNFIRFYYLTDYDMYMMELGVQ